MKTDEFVINKKGVLTKYNGTDEHVVVPEGITEIYASSFRWKGMRWLTLPNGLKIIGKAAFFGCDQLERVEIPASVELIRQSAFADCTALKEAVLPEGMKVIPDCMFYYCKSLEKINLPRSLEKIGGGAFHACYALGDIAIPEGVTEIGPNAFSGITALREIKLPEGLKEIEPCTFENSWHLRRIEIPASVEIIRFNAFENCPELTEVIFHEGLKEIGDGAFSYCKKLTKFTLPQSLERENRAFTNTAYFEDEANRQDGVLYLGRHLSDADRSLAGSYAVRAGTKSVSDHAFDGCKKLKKVFLPKSVMHVGCFAFCDCKSLTIYAEAESEPAGWDNGWNPDHRPVVWGAAFD